MGSEKLSKRTENRENEQRTDAINFKISKIIGFNASISIVCKCHKYNN